jgi:hypothetical protein
VYRKIVFAAAQGASFEEASAMLRELCELILLSKRVWRAARRIGEERMEECRAAAEVYQQLPLPQQQQSPTGRAPQVACVQMDGGRYQRRARDEAEVSDSSDDKYWKEYKAGCLLSMTSEVFAEDPCPELPATFVDPGKMREMAREIKGFTSESAVSVDVEEVSVEVASPSRPGFPEVLVKSVVASSGDAESFGPLLMSAAYERGFNAAERKAFVADGSSTNWGVWQRFFSHYTPIVDFVHALMYVYAGALAGRAVDEGWVLYRDWAQWLWSGQVDLVIAALQRRAEELGLPEKDEKGTPRAQVDSSLKYMLNQRSRMKYAEYRRQGLPITSSAIESTIKQINRRIKGTEKFWDQGVESMLHLVADRLSQTQVADKFWARRTHRIIQQACYQHAA